jgi:CubicO group peptidase (beta-lactamase class C family)
VLAAARLTAAPSNPGSSAARAIDAYTKPLLARGELAGQLLVTRAGQVVAERFYGQADAELGVPVGAETRFNIASVTKPMTTPSPSSSSQGKLRLGDSLAAVQDFPKGDGITVSMLLRHRSGIPHSDPGQRGRAPVPPAELVERARRLPLDFPPGSRESYSSGGYEVLARVLELVSHKSYGELLEERIFKPLGMTRSANADSRALLPGRACAYVPGPRGLENAAFQDFSSITGAGSVWSTAGDLDRLVQGIVSGRLGEGRDDRSCAPVASSISTAARRIQAWAVWGARAARPRCFVSNRRRARPTRSSATSCGSPRGRHGVATRAARCSRRRRRPKPNCAAGRRFQLENGGPRLSVRLRNGALYSNDWVMLPTADGAMFSPRDYGVIRRVDGKDGTAERLDWLQGSQVYPAPRVPGTH